MATSTSVATAENGAYAITLTGSSVDTVTFGRDCDAVEVTAVNGAAAIYFTVDGSTPTVGGKGTFEVLALAGWVTQVDVPTAGNTVVKLISSGAASYSVVGSL